MFDGDRYVSESRNYSWLCFVLNRWILKCNRQLLPSLEQKICKLIPMNFNWFIFIYWITYDIQHILWREQILYKLAHSLTTQASCTIESGTTECKDQEVVQVSFARWCHICGEFDGDVGSWSRVTRIKGRNHYTIEKQKVFILSNIVCDRVCQRRNKIFNIKNQKLTIQSLFSYQH